MLCIITFSLPGLAYSSCLATRASDGFGAVVVDVAKILSNRGLGSSFAQIASTDSQYPARVPRIITHCCPCLCG